MRHWRNVAVATALGIGGFAGCALEDPSRLRDGQPEGADALPNVASPPGGDAIPGGELPDEQFPPELLEPYTGPPIDDYDDTFIGYRQLVARIVRIFADPGIGGNTTTFFASRIALLGGADFVQTFTEPRVATSDFLLGLDAVAKGACSRAAINATGPFVGLAPATAADVDAIVAQLHRRILFREATTAETNALAGLFQKLRGLGSTPTDAWAGACEALVRHPDAIFTLPPSVATASPTDARTLRLAKLTHDLVGRPPTVDEIAQFATNGTGDTPNVDAAVSHLLALPDFASDFYHRARVRTESGGTPETDEPARLWAYLATTGAPFAALLTADYTVDASFAKIARPTEHGRTGILTMPGFIKTKPGLPHYNYPARVMSEYLGQLYEVTSDVVLGRTPAASTVEPGTTCIACHGVLTPLATQRLRWKDDGTYRTHDDDGAAIDDSDRNLVADYPYKGQGMAGFAARAVKKERFLRQSFQALFLFYFGRPMRYALDERTVYLALWKKAFATGGDTRELIKILANVPSYLGK